MGFTPCFHQQSVYSVPVCFTNGNSLEKVITLVLSQKYFEDNGAVEV